MSIKITLMGGTYCQGDVSSHELCILTISHLSRLPLFLQSLSSETLKKMPLEYSYVLWDTTTTHYRLEHPFCGQLSHTE